MLCEICCTCNEKTVVSQQLSVVIAASLPRFLNDMNIYYNDTAKEMKTANPANPVIVYGGQHRKKPIKAAECFTYHSLLSGQW